MRTRTIAHPRPAFTINAAIRRPYCPCRQCVICPDHLSGAAGFACSIPICPAPVKRKGHPVERLPFQPYCARRDFQPHPCSCRRQRPHVPPALCTINTPSDIICPPVSPVIPAPILIPLQHDL